MTQHALSVPSFRTSMDGTPWVLGGLWPTDLQRVTAETAAFANYLHRICNCIANMTNDRLGAIAEAGVDEQVRDCRRRSMTARYQPPEIGALAPLESRTGGLPRQAYTVGCAQNSQVRDCSRRSDRKSP